MKKPQVIVSLTSFPGALHLAPVAIRSIFSGTVLPDRVVLYLTASQFPDGKLPAAIEELKDSNQFEVRFYDENIRSYTKLIPALADFPDDIIITIDDDIRYHRRMVEKLLHWHGKRPDAILAHNIRRITADKQGNIIRYFDWKRAKPRRYLWHHPVPSYRNLLFGVGGVLYPPHCLAPEMLDPKLFMEMAPTVDDVWFWAAAVAKGTKISPVPWGYWKLDELEKPNEVALSTGNTRSGVDVNRIAVEKIIEKYPTIKQRLWSSF